MYRRILLYLPCCIGDVVLATATLAALRRAYPDAHIAWAVGSWSHAVLTDHPLLNEIIDAGPAALPFKTINGFIETVRLLRAGNYDLLVSLVRSPLMSMAALASGISTRAGLDSGGRGFGYSLRATIDPQIPRLEAEIYLDVARVLGINTSGCYAHVPVPAAPQILAARYGIVSPYIIINPAGGMNPGMSMTSKRYPPAQLAALAERIAVQLKAQIVVLAGPSDAALVEELRSHLHAPAVELVGVLSFKEIAMLAVAAKCYIGNDTGVTHLAAAAGALTFMIFGPSDPRRYAPYTLNSHALWKPTALPAGGVAAGAPRLFDWARDGISVDEAEAFIMRIIHPPVP
ncbi:MAG: glycosyltransferase family 9 protein [Chloroflexota bacterium]|nr:glycosyltransferase family 9 protein [Chloroflexota bacterium]